jgi:hypothetical protein
VDRVQSVEQIFDQLIDEAVEGTQHLGRLDPAASRSSRAAAG